MNIFEKASRTKLRFSTVVGNLTAEQLWDLPLTARKDNLDLDKIARYISRDIRETSEDSFVKVNPDPRKAENELRLEIVKHIIDVKMKSAADAEAALARRERRNKLLDALAKKEDAELSSMSREDLLKALAETDEAA